jgi:hypothetical protein
MDDLEKVFKDLKNIESSGGKLPFESLQSDKEKQPNLPEQKLKLKNLMTTTSYHNCLPPFQGV